MGVITLLGITLLPWMQYQTICKANLVIVFTRKWLASVIEWSMGNLLVIHWR